MRRIVLGLLAAVLLSACNQGAPPQDSGSATVAPNDADVTFTQNMIAHHQQVIDAQQAEIDQLTQWQQQWEATPDR